MSNVIQIDEMRLTQKSRFEMGRRADCRHLHLTTDEEGDIVKCDDCGMQVSAFWALRMLSEHYERAMAKLKNRENVQTMAEQRTIHLRAAQTVESAWRSRTMVPTCPHCGEGIAPTDGFGRSAINKQIDERRRAERRKA